MLGARVREERERQGLSQKKLAEIADCSKRTIVALEQEKNVTRKVIEKVAHALGLEEIPLDDVRLVRTAQPFVASAARHELRVLVEMLDGARLCAAQLDRRIKELDQTMEVRQMGDMLSFHKTSERAAVAAGDIIAESPTKDRDVVEAADSVDEAYAALGKARWILRPFAQLSGIPQTVESASPVPGAGAVMERASHSYSDQSRQTPSRRADRPARPPGLKLDEPQVEGGQGESIGSAGKAKRKRGTDKSEVRLRRKD